MERKFYDNVLLSIKNKRNKDNREIFKKKTFFIYG